MASVSVSPVSPFRPVLVSVAAAAALALFLPVLVLSAVDALGRVLSWAARTLSAVLAVWMTLAVVLLWATYETIRRGRGLSRPTLDSAADATEALLARPADEVPWARVPVPAVVPEEPIAAPRASWEASEASEEPSAVPDVPEAPAAVLGVPCPISGLFPPALTEAVPAVALPLSAEEAPAVAERLTRAFWAHLADLALETATVASLIPEPVPAEELDPAVSAVGEEASSPIPAPALLSAVPCHPPLFVRVERTDGRASRAGKVQYRHVALKGQPTPGRTYWVRRPDGARGYLPWVHGTAASA